MKGQKKFLQTIALASTCCLFLNSVFFSNTLDTENDREEASRDLSSLNLGDGTCKWGPPSYEVPEDIDFYKTIIAGFPSGDKRLAFIQMEALTGWAAKDEWDFKFLGMTNNPFIKANYPHHEGIWGWEDAGDQVMLVVRNLRRSIVEYHDILWDIGYAKTWEEASEAKLTNLFQERPPLDDFLAWRDLLVMDEIHWYGWFIDYWMEEGLLRDIFTHKITTQKHWDMLMQPTAYSKDEVAYDVIVGNDTVVTPTYDSHCLNDVSGGCHPVQVISAERLVKAATGPAEARKIALVMNHTGIAEYVLDEEVWQCIWTELIINKKGVKTFIDREGLEERDYSFSEEMLAEMINELDRLLNKYSSTEWYWRQTSRDLVDLFEEHRALIQAEYDEVVASGGARALRQEDFLGPKERKRRKLKALEDELLHQIQDGEITPGMEDRRSLDLLLTEQEESNKKDYGDFFATVHKELFERRRETIKSQVFSDDMSRRNWQNHRK